MKFIEATEKVKHIDQSEVRTVEQNYKELGVFLLHRLKTAAIVDAYREACECAKHYSNMATPGAVLWYPHYLQICAMLEAELKSRSLGEPS